MPDSEEDPNNGAKVVRDLYELAGDYDGTRSVPILWDKQEKTIVNNESSELIVMLNQEFNEWAKNKIDLNPESLRDA